MRARRKRTGRVVRRIIMADRGRWKDMLMINEYL
jgi:hypothetical protein